MQLNGLVSILSREDPPKNLRKVTTEDIVNLWKKQGGRCAYSNLVMTWGKINERDRTVSIERLEKG